MDKALTLTSGLMFRSKLDMSLREVGLLNVTFRDPADLASILAESEIRIVILDLCHKSFDVLKIITDLRGAPIDFSGPILCYSSHVERELMEKASELGATKVVANSRMSARGAVIIAELLQEG